MTADNDNNITNNPSVAEIMAEDEWFDLLPIEKKLISWSLGTGIFLLIIFILVFVVFK